MFNKNLQFSVSFVIIAVMQLITDFDQNAAKIVLGDFFYFIKPSITISLMIFFVYNSALRGRFAKLIFLGLLFGLFGDVFLMLVKQYPSAGCNIKWKV